MKNYQRIEKQLVQAVTALRNGTEHSLYHVATLCVALFNDSDDYAAAVGISGDEVIDRLNGYLSDFAIDLADCVTLLAHFPDREQWSRPLLELLDEARAAARPAEEKERRCVRRATLKELEAANKRAADAEYAMARMTSEVDQLRAENSELRRENLTLRGRVEQLERMFSRREALV